jgi:hypothetical protein
LTCTFTLPPVTVNGTSVRVRVLHTYITVVFA